MENVREHESTRAMIKRENALVTEMNRLRTEIAHEQRVNMEVSLVILFNLLFFSDIELSRFPIKIISRLKVG